ncbi:hypothetical protein INH39_25415 [Massilia violaceinigra]|uniref:Uncharacterized protein n=1 Tax=Massilia violaceinigra TaxID=2045208 RepID=A0ABY4A1X1_9BURK|nr:hypothetical protein [Massilia violaceinigra]UOD28750.1 hypothetical protein INH39_25415 [Massilia violaceinigra]
MNEQKLQGAWKLVPVEPTNEMLHALHVSPDCIGSAIVKHSVDKLPDAYTAMLAAAPVPAPWSSCTAPGPDGYQSTVQVPGMPGAARDAALEEAAAFAESVNSHGQFIAAHIRALKSIAAPAPVQQAAPSVQAELVEALRDMLSGWRYIRQSHGDLYGVGWDRAENKASAALERAAAPSQPDGLSEQDKLDAARYRWLRDIAPLVDIAAPLVFHTDRDGYALGIINPPKMDEVIDAAILAAKEAP